MRSHPAQSSRMRPLFSWEPVKELSIGWISAVRPSRQPLRGFLRIRNFLNAIDVVPHAEERPPSRRRLRRLLRTTAASRSTHHARPADTPEPPRFFHKL